MKTNEELELIAVETRRSIKRINEEITNIVITINQLFDEIYDLNELFDEEKDEY